MVPLVLNILNAVTAPITVGYPPIIEPDELILNDVDDVVHGPSAEETVPVAQLALAFELVRYVAKIKPNDIKKIRQLWGLNLNGIGHGSN
jgi:hypothetical protein